MSRSPRRASAASSSRAASTRSASRRAARRRLHPRPGAGVRGGREASARSRPEQPTPRGARPGAGPRHDGRRGQTRLRVLASARAAGLVLPDDVAFSHCTAAALLPGLPVPETARAPLAAPLGARRAKPPHRPARVPRPTAAWSRARQPTLMGGVPVVGDGANLVRLGADLLGLDDLVVLGDTVASTAGHGGTTRRGPPGRRRPGRAAPGCLIDARRCGGSGSAPARRWRAAPSCCSLRSRAARARAQPPGPCHDDGPGFLCVSGTSSGARRARSHRRVPGRRSLRELRPRRRRHLPAPAGRGLDGWKYIEVTKNDYFNTGRRHSMLQPLRPLPRRRGGGKSTLRGGAMGRFATPSGRAERGVSAGRRR